LMTALASPSGELRTKSAARPPPPLGLFIVDYLQLMRRRWPLTAATATGFQEISGNFTRTPRHCQRLMYRY